MLETIMPYVSYGLSNVCQAIAFVNIVLIVDCFLGGSYKVGKRLWLIAGVWFVYSLVVQFVFGLVFGIIMVIIKGAENIDPLQDMTTYKDYFSLAITLTSELYFFVYFLIGMKGKKWVRRILFSLGLSLLPVYLSGYTNSLFSAVFTIGVGSIEKYSTNLFLGEGLATHLTVILAFLLQSALFAVLYFRFYQKGIRMRISLWYVAAFALGLLLFRILCTLPFSELNSVEENYKIMSLYLAVILPSIGIAFPMILIAAVASVRFRERTAAQESYLAAELEYIEQYKRKEQETRAFRHDLKNQLSLLDMSLSEGRFDEAKEHVKEMLGRSDELSLRIQTGDEMLDCIAAMKCEKMKEEGIAFSCEGVCEGGLPLKPMDLCVIFANAFDNAIESCVREREKASGSGSDFGPDPMKIDLKITHTDSFYVFRLTNPCDENLDAESIYDPNLVVTSKKDTRHHGFGTKNLLRTVNGYGGIVSAKREENTFVLGITLPRKVG